MMTGAGHLRFLLQPLMAIVFGVVAGLHDSHTGRSPFRQRAAGQGRRAQARTLKEELDRMTVPLLLAIALSLVFQHVNRHSVRLWPALAAAIVLVALPYLVARELSCRVDMAWQLRHPRRSDRARVS
jgi:hypothetical protein